MAKVLVVSNILFPPINAGSMRCMQAYTALLSDMDNDVYYLYSGRSSVDQIKLASKYWGEHFLYYKYSNFLRIANYLKRGFIHFITLGRYTVDYYYPMWGLKRFVRKSQKKYQFECIIVNYIWMTKLFNTIPINKKILFSHDSFTNKSERINERMYSLSPNQESKGLKRCDVILSIQSEESTVFSYLAPSIPVYSVYMPITFRKTDIIEGKNILFFSGDSDLNVNGIMKFINGVFEKIIKNNPEIQLFIGGGICRSLHNITHSNIHLLGCIDNVDNFYEKGNVVINPVYQGTGLKIKTLESISYGKVTVVHPHSVEGLYKKEKVPVIVAYDDDMYVDILTKLFCGDIDMLQIKQACEEYLSDMNDYIKKQYRKVGF